MTGKLATMKKKDTKIEWLKKRLEVITSTEVSALFDANPYMTHFELWHRKHDQEVVEIEPNERMKWGTRLEPAIAKGIAEDQGWKIKPLKFMRMVEHRIGASFDYEIVPDGLLECKNVDGYAYKEGWAVEGDEVEAPPHIEFQVQVELMVSEKKFAYIGALVGGNRVVLLKREPIPSVQAAIIERVGKFWASIESNTPPPIDFQRDAEFISKLYGRATEGKTIDISVDEDAIRAVADYQAGHLMETEGKAKKAAAKAALLLIMKDAEKATHEKFTVSAQVRPATEIPATTRKEYRDFRVYFKKEKGE